MAGFSKVGRSASAFKVKGRFLWFGNPVGKLERLKNSIQKRILLKATRKGTAIYRQFLKKAPTPKRTGKLGGSLRRAMFAKAYRPKRTAKAIGVTGPKSKFQKEMGVRKRGKNKGKPIIHKPGKIMHLVERGFTTRNGRNIPGQGFMKQAFKSHWRKVRDEMWRIIGEEVTKELAKQ